jgi:hypothetical protein
MHTVDHYKQIVERDFKARGEPIPNGFAITYNEETQLVKVFLNTESYTRLREAQDEIVSQWKDGKWIN